MARPSRPLCVVRLRLVRNFLFPNFVFTLILLIQVHCYFHSLLFRCSLFYICQMLILILGFSWSFDSLLLRFIQCYRSVTAPKCPHCELQVEFATLCLLCRFGMCKLIVVACDDTVSFPVDDWLRCDYGGLFWEMSLLLFRQAKGNAILLLGPLQCR